MGCNTDIPTVPVKCDIADLSIAVVTGLAFVYIALFFCILPLSGEIASGRDFVVYWATGQQLVHHANPYDADAMMRIERSAGLSAGYGVLFMRNPPWSLPLVLPLGFIGLRAGALLWSLLLLICLLISVRILWQTHGRPANHVEWLGVSFAPALLCLSMGQTTLLALLGYVLFLRLHGSHQFLAGLSLWLCALKPHLFLPFAIVLLAWILVSRSYKILAGAAAAMAMSCAILYLVDASAWLQYTRMMRTAGVDSAPVPCLSVALRLWLSPGATWLQYLPVALGCAWALGYYWFRRQGWEWSKNGNPVLLISLVTAPYSWVYDGCLAIPALLYGAFFTRSRMLLTLLAATSLLIVIEVARNIRVTSNFYLWTAPAWLVWYLWASATVHKRRTCKPSLTAE
jgi:hypothetical protein